MTGQWLLTYTLLASTAVLFVLYVNQCFKTIRMAKAGFRTLQTANHLEAQLTTARTVGDDFLNSCRLIGIHRKDRMNVFTFARGDEIFIIETMGLLSDQPDEWRDKAGLK